MGKYEVLIGTAGILGLISKIYRTNNTESLPWTWILLNITAQLLSLIYGIKNNAVGIYIPNSIFLCGLMYIFYVKQLNKSNETEIKDE